MIQATTSLTRAESVRDCNGALEVLKPEPGSSCKRHTEPPVHSLPRGAKIGIGGPRDRRHPCHTTRRAGPHRAVRGCPDFCVRGIT